MSQVARILAVLRDGKSHTVREIHQRAGYSRLNSRVAELRERGYVIRCDHLEADTATERYAYVLLSSPPKAAPVLVPLPLPGQQLSLIGATYEATAA